MFSTKEMTDVLLFRTFGCGTEFLASLILLWALNRLRNNGEHSKGFTTIASLMLAISILRTVRLIYLWISIAPPQWLEPSIFTFFLVTVLSVPLVLSIFYLPRNDSLPRSRRGRWIHWLMVVNALLGLAVLSGAAMTKHFTLIAPVAATACALSAVLLHWRVQVVDHRHLRQRSIRLFTWLTSLGLLGLTINLMVLTAGGPQEGYFLHSPFAAASSELCIALVVLGMMFVFTNIRLADLIVKRVLGVYASCTAALLLWFAVQYCYPTAEHLHQSVFSSFAAIVSLAVILFTLPSIVRIFDRAISRWIFQLPHLESTIQQFWEQAVTLDSQNDLYRAAESCIRASLSLAAVRIVSLHELGTVGEAFLVSGQTPHFLPLTSPMRSIVSTGVDILVPLFEEDLPAHWIALSQGAARPPLTSSEVNFVVRVASAIHIRAGTIRAGDRKLATMRREGTLKQELADAELRALRAQVNPHFLFNSLNTIADLSVAEPLKAEEMTLRLAAVFRYVLAHSERQYTSVQEEIGFARSYLGIEEARFGQRLQVHFVVEPATLHEQIPALILQPLIENALKHGIGNRREGGSLEIEVHRTDSGFSMTVADDGVGLGELVAPSDEVHVGVRNVRRRLESAFGSRASFQLGQRTTGGTVATILIDRPMERTL